MPRNIESALEQTVEVLKKAQELKLLTNQELRVIVKKRRDYEYSLSQSSVNRKNFLKYAVFEKDLSSLLKKRMLAQRAKLQSRKGVGKNGGKEDRSSQLQEMHSVVGNTASRVNHIYSRALKKYPGDSKLWIHYARYCIDNNMLTAASRVFMEAIAVCGSDENVWLSAMTFHFDKLGDARTARAVAQRSLRMLPSSVNLWLEYFRMELYYLARLTARRFALGLCPDDQGANTDKDVEILEEPKSPAAGMEAIQCELENGEGEEKSSTEEQQNLDKVTFWNGGVPFAVLKGACNKMVLNELDCVKFYNIAAECPLVPAKLLSVMVPLFHAKFPSSTVVFLLSKRAEWDMMKAQWDRKVEKVKNKSGQSSDEVSAMFTARQNDLSEIANRVLAELVKTFAEDENNTQRMELATGLTKETLECVLNNMENLMTEFSDTIDLALFFKLRNASTGARDHNIQITNDDPNSWDAKMLGQYLERGYDDLNISSDSLSECVKRTCLKPFRDNDAERALCLYIKRDLEASEWDELYNSLIALVPVTFSSLVPLAEALIQYLDKTNPKDVGDFNGKCTQIRKLLSMASSLSDASRNVLFWRLYLDFERRVAKDAKRASAVNANAIRTLDTMYHANFVELQTLANLHSLR